MRDHCRDCHGPIELTTYCGGCSKEVCTSDCPAGTYTMARALPDTLADLQEQVAKVEEDRKVMGWYAWSNEQGLRNAALNRLLQGCETCGRLAVSSIRPFDDLGKRLK